MKKQRIWDRLESHCLKHSGEHYYVTEAIKKLAMKFDEFISSLVECEKCGCLLKKEMAIKGKSIIKKKQNCNKCPYKNPCLSGLFKTHPCPPTEEHIHTTYYCKLHTPKRDKK